MSGEVVVIAGFNLKSTGTVANAQVRGVSGKALEIRDNVRVIQGRFFKPGLAELVVGRNAVKSYAGFDLGSTVKFGGGTWTVVGIFDAGGSAFDSEIWCDANVLSQVYKRPQNVFQSVTARLESPAGFSAFKDALTSDPRLSVQVDRETEYYEKQSRGLTTMIRVLGFLVAFVMGIGAVFGALNTMYSAVAERAREIATIRALGFGRSSLIVSFVLEALFIALLGGMRRRAAHERLHDRNHELADVLARRLRVQGHARVARPGDRIRPPHGPGRRRAAGCARRAQADRRRAPGALGRFADGDGEFSPVKCAVGDRRRAVAGLGWG